MSESSNSSSSSQKNKVRIEARRIHSRCRDLSRSRQYGRIDEEGEPSDDLRARYIAAGFIGRFDNPEPRFWCDLLSGFKAGPHLPHVLDGTLQHQVDTTDLREVPIERPWISYVDWEITKLHVVHADGEEVEGFASPSVEWTNELGDRTNWGGMLITRLAIPSWPDDSVEHDYRFGFGLSLGFQLACRSRIALTSSLLGSGFF